MVTKKYMTSDIGLASYIMLKGGKLISTRRGRQGYEIVFDNSNGLCEQYSVEYLKFLNFGSLLYKRDHLFYHMK